MTTLRRTVFNHFFGTVFIALSNTFSERISFFEVSLTFAFFAGCFFFWGFVFVYIVVFFSLSLSAAVFGISGGRV